MTEAREPNRLLRTRVLVADDHAAMRETIQTLLRGEFDVVGSAVDGEQALDLARTLRPDVIVLDVDMPKLDGFAVAERLGEDRSSPHIVFLSVHSESEYAPRAAGAGGLAYVQKADLYRRLTRAVRLAAAGRFAPQRVVHAGEDDVEEPPAEP